MSASNYLSYINHSIATGNISNKAIEDASSDVGLTIDNYLRRTKKGIMLHNAHLESYKTLVANGPFSDREATYGNYISALLYQQALYAKDLNMAITRSQGYSNILRDINDSSNMIITLLQSAGNNPISVNSSIKMWKKYTDDLLHHIQTKDTPNLVQLNSFHIANHTMRLLS